VRRRSREPNMRCHTSFRGRRARAPLCCFARIEAVRRLERGVARARGALRPVCERACAGAAALASLSKEIDATRALDTTAKHAVRCAAAHESMQCRVWSVSSREHAAHCPCACQRACAGATTVAKAKREMQHELSRPPSTRSAVLLHTNRGSAAFGAWCREGTRRSASGVRTSLCMRGGGRESLQRVRSSTSSQGHCQARAQLCCCARIDAVSRLERGVARARTALSLRLPTSLRGRDYGREIKREPNVRCRTSSRGRRARAPLCCFARIEAVLRLKCIAARARGTLRPRLRTSMRGRGVGRES
jgi:hypothetical protein